MSGIYAILRHSDQSVSAVANLSEGAFLKRTGSDAKLLRLYGLGRVSAFVLACCLTIALSGCGSGAVDPAGGGLFVTPNTVNFGNVPVGHEVDNNLVVTNTSSSSIAVSQVNISGQSFALARDSCRAAYQSFARSS